MPSKINCPTPDILLSQGQVTFAPSLATHQHNAHHLRRYRPRRFGSSPNVARPQSTGHHCFQRSQKNRSMATPGGYGCHRRRTRHGRTTGRFSNGYPVVSAQPTSRSIDRYGGRRTEIINVHPECPGWIRHQESGGRIDLRGATGRGPR